MIDHNGTQHDYAARLSGSFWRAVVRYRFFRRSMLAREKTRASRSHGRCGKGKPLRGKTKAAINGRTPNWRTSTVSGPWTGTLQSSMAHSDGYQYSVQYRLAQSGSGDWQWQVVAGTATAASGDCSATSYSASSPYTFSSGGGSLTGQVSASGGQSSFCGYTKQYELGSDGSSWIATGAAGAPAARAGPRTRPGPVTEVRPAAAAVRPRPARILPAWAG